MTARRVQDGRRLPHRPEEGRASSASSGQLRAGGRPHRQQGGLCHRLLGADGVRRQEQGRRCRLCRPQGRLSPVGDGRLPRQEPEPHRRADESRLSSSSTSCWAAGTAPRSPTLRGYMTNPTRPTTPRHIPTSSRPRRPRRSPTSPPMSAESSRKGGTWQNRWPTDGRRLRGGVGALQGGVSDARVASLRSCCPGCLLHDLRARAWRTAASCRACRSWSIAVWSAPCRAARLTIAVSFWKRAAPDDPAAFDSSRPTSPSSTGARLLCSSAASSSPSRRPRSACFIAYPIAYFLARHGAAAATRARAPPVHRALPGQLHHPDLRLDLSPRPHRPGQ